MTVVHRQREGERTVKAARWIFGIVVAGLVLAGVMWLAGAIFFVLSKANPFGKVELLTWWAYYQHYADAPVYGKRLVVSALAAAGILGCLAVMVWIGVTRNTRSLHGDARFANNAELAKAGLYGENGILVGKHKGRFLMFGGQQFVLLAAPTRSGKGVSFVIPNLLQLRDSVVVLDVKQENFNITSGYRHRHGQEIYLFNPFAEDYRTSRYNPLGYVRDGDMRAGDLIAIGEVLYPSGGRDAFFDDQARNLFLGLGLYLCETPELPRTIGEMLRQSSGKGQPIKEYLEGVIAARDEEDRPLSDDCTRALFQFINTSDNTRSSILASFNAPLGIWANPIVDAATSANDFDLRDVRKRRMSVYIGITPDHLAEAGRIVNLLFSQLVNLNTKELPQSNKALKYQCVLMMDEFTAIGMVGIIAKAVSYMAGYNLRLATIIQTPAQVEDDVPRGYGRQGARTLITNHALQILFAPREQTDAEAYSKMLGDETVKGKSTSRQLDKSQRSETISDQRRALLLPQEIKDIGQEREIVIVENTKPILCEKAMYFREPVFMDRLKEVSASLRAIGRALPSRAVLDAAIEAGELAAPVPLLDVDTHKAKLEKRIRVVTLAEAEQGLDVNKLALDVQSLPDVETDANGEPDPEQVNAFVDAFFSQLESASCDEDIGEDGTSPAPSAEEAAALEHFALHGEFQNVIEPAHLEGSASNSADEEGSTPSVNSSRAAGGYAPGGDRLAGLDSSTHAGGTTQSAAGPKTPQQAEELAALDFAADLLGLGAGKTARNPSVAEEAEGMDLGVLDKPN
jgi:type IV secretion system protein VirD4